MHAAPRTKSPPLEGLLGHDCYPEPYHSGFLHREGEIILDRGRENIDECGCETMGDFVSLNIFYVFKVNWGSVDLILEIFMYI